MSISYIPEQQSYKEITPFRRFVLQSFPWINETFDALTNYELMGKIIEYLNDVISNENTVQSNMTELYNAFVELHDYVMNLDLQDEVNNKLDEMVEDGTFDNILNNYVYDELTKNLYTSIFGEYIVSSNDYSQLQGGCITDNYIVCGFNNKTESSNSLIVIFNKNNLNVINILNDFSYYHVDNMFYANGNLYIQDKTNKTIYEIDEDDLTEQTTTFKNTYVYTDSIGTVTYNSSNNKFYSAITKYIYELNNDFEIVDTIETNDLDESSVVQSLDIIDDKFIILKTTTSTTTFAESIQNNIVVTNRKGKIISKYEIAYSGINEIEFVKYLSNGLFVGGATIPRTDVKNALIKFYYLNIFNNSVINKYTVSNKRFIENYNELNSNQTFNLYLDNTTTNVVCDGSSSYPFHDLFNLINYIASMKTSNYIRVYAKGDFSGQTNIIRNNKSKIMFQSIDNNNRANLGILNVTNSNFEFTNINMKQLLAENSNITITNCIISNSGGTAISLNKSKLVIAGANTSITGSQNGIVGTYNSIIMCLDNKIASLVSSNTWDIRLNSGSFAYLLNTEMIKIYTDNNSKQEIGVIYLASNTNLNDLLYNANYSSQANGTTNLVNLPTSYNDGDFELVCEMVGSNLLKQTIKPYYKNTSYTRIYNKGTQTFSSWYAAS